MFSHFEEKSLNIMFSFKIEALDFHSGGQWKICYAVSENLELKYMHLVASELKEITDSITDNCISST